MSRHTSLLVASILALVALAGCSFAEDLDEVKAKAEAQRDLSSNASPLCIQYCDLALEGCKGGDTLFEDEVTCFAACEEFPDNGVDTERYGDTVQCRVSHLITALELEPSVHCAHGSPGGGGTCTGVSRCGSYCGFMLETCGEFQFFDSSNFRDDCTSTCLTYSMLGNDNDETGNSFQCRYRAALAATDDPQTHCPNAGPDGGAQCTGVIPPTE